MLQQPTTDQGAKNPTEPVKAPPVQLPKPGEILPAANRAEAAAARLQKLSEALLPEAEKIAKDPKLKGLYPLMYGLGADGDYVVLPPANPELALEAVKRLQELSREMPADLKKRLQAAGIHELDGSVRLPSTIKQSEDQFLASNQVSQVEQRLRVWQRFFDTAQGRELASLQEAHAPYVEQLVKLLDRAKGQKTEDLRIMTVGILGSIGSPYADGAYGRIDELRAETKDDKLRSACEGALKKLKPPATEKEAPAEVKPPELKPTPKP